MWITDTHSCTAEPILDETAGNIGIKHIQPMNLLVTQHCIDWTIKPNNTLYILYQINNPLIYVRQSNSDTLCYSSRTYCYRICKTNLF